MKFKEMLQEVNFRINERNKSELVRSIVKDIQKCQTLHSTDELKTNLYPVGSYTFGNHQIEISHGNGGHEFSYTDKKTGKIVIDYFAVRNDVKEITKDVIHEISHFISRFIENMPITKLGTDTDELDSLCSEIGNKIQHDSSPEEVQEIKNWMKSGANIRNQNIPKLLNDYVFDLEALSPKLYKSFLGGLYDFLYNKKFKEI